MARTPPTVETLKLENEVAVQWAADHVPRRKAASLLSPHLSQRGASARLHAPQIRRSRWGRVEAADASLLQPPYPLPQIAASIKTTPPTPTVAAASPRV